MPDPDSTAELLDDQVVSLAPVRRESSGPPLRWLALGGVVAIAVAVWISYAGRTEPPLAAVGSALPSASALIALESSAPSPTADVNLCAEGSTDMQPQPAGAELPRLLTPLRLTQPGALALAIEEDRTSGEVIVARSAGDEAGTVEYQAVARFTGYDIQLPRTVTPVAWSTEGDTILVNAGHLDQFEPERNCNDLFLVRADGSGVTRLTRNGPGEWANSSSISPDGRLVAFVVGGQLRLTEVDRGTFGVPLSTCDRPDGPSHWSPDGWLLVICGQSISVADLLAGGSHLYGAAAGGESEGSLPRDSLPVAAAWTADGQSIIAVTAQSGLSQLGPLKVVEIKRADGTPTASVATETSTEWVLGTTTMSPDARWALVQGDGNAPAATWFPTYAVNTSTGDATKLPWTVLHDATGPSSVSWLAEPNRFLYEEDQALYEVDLAAMTRTEVGAIPASDYAWFESGAFTPATP